MFITHTEAQELHELIGAALEAVRNGQTAVVAELERARELAALIVSDTSDPLPDLDTMRADLDDAGQTDEVGPRKLRALWCDLFRVDPSHPEFVGLEEADR